MAVIDLGQQASGDCNPLEAHGQPTVDPVKVACTAPGDAGFPGVPSL